MPVGEPVRQAGPARADAAAECQRDNMVLALPGHSQDHPMDGNLFPTQNCEVPLLPLLSYDAIVEMNAPGVWVLGSTLERAPMGLGIVIEYAGKTGTPVWKTLPRRVGLQTVCQRSGGCQTR